MINERTDRLLLNSAMLGSFLTALSTRIFMISLPSVANGLGTDIPGISLALISFQLAAISFSIAFGRLGDIFGRRRICGLGFIILAASSFLCGISQNVIQLIVFRFIQGIGGAMTQSVARALAMDAMPERSEGKTQGIMTIAFHSGFLLGPAIGGIIVDYINWRSTFFFLIPFGLVGAGLSYAGSFESSVPMTRRQVSFDYVGVTLFTVLTLILTILLERKFTTSFGVWEKSLLTLALPALLWAFLTHEARTSSPMMNLSLFKIPMFTYSIVTLLAVSITRSFITFILPFYLQGVLHIPVSLMGIMFLTAPLVTIALSTFSGHITDRIGPRTPATIGVGMSIAALMVGVNLGIQSHWILPTLMIVLLGLGNSFFDTSNQAAIIGSVPKEYRGFAAGIIHAAFGLGHMLGVAFSALLLAFTFQYYSGVSDAMPSPENPFAFVSSMNTSYAAAIVIGLLGLFASLMRGSGKIQASPAIPS